MPSIWIRMLNEIYIYDKTDASVRLETYVDVFQESLPLRISFLLDFTCIVLWIWYIFGMCVSVCVSLWVGVKVYALT